MLLPKYIVRLTADERTQLKEWIHTGKRAASVLIHARILLTADVGAGGPGRDDERIAEAVACGASTVYRGAPGVRGKRADSGVVSEKAHWPTVSQTRWRPGGATDRAGV